MGEYTSLTDQALKDMIDSIDVDMRIDPKHQILLFQEVFSRMLDYKLDVKWSVTTGITASTTQTQAGGVPLTTTVNKITVCATENNAVTLPSAVAGLVCIIVNSGAETARIFPAVGDDAGAGANNAITIATTVMRIMVALDSTTWQNIVV